MRLSLIKPILATRGIRSKFLRPAKQVHRPFLPLFPEFCTYFSLFHPLSEYHPGQGQSINPFRRVARKTAGATRHQVQRHALIGPNSGHPLNGWCCDSGSFDLVYQFLTPNGLKNPTLIFREKNTWFRWAGPEATKCHGTHWASRTRSLAACWYSTS